jgi:gamma-glutamyl-gamma-aminobutyraldehyde dehydrogenase
MSLYDLNTWRERAQSIRLQNLAFINGQFVPAQDGQTFATINPANGRKQTEVAACQAHDIDLDVRAARRSN